MQNPILIDIGSYQGQEIEWGLKHGYEVHAFEPNPRCRIYLEQYEDKAEINYAAAWNEDGVANLHLMFNPEPGEDGVSLIATKQNVSSDRLIQVPTINTGGYLAGLDKDIEILKINAEGSEYIILESILNDFDYKRIKHWLVEDHRNYIVDAGWTKKKVEVIKRLINLGIDLKHYKFLESLEDVNT